MKLAVITEKPHVTQVIAPQVLDAYAVDSFVALHALPIHQWEFVLPRGVRWSEYPLLRSPEYRRDAQHTLLPRAVTRDASGLYGIRLDELNTEAAKQQACGADLILYACDPDPIGALGFMKLMTELLGPEEALRPRPAVLLMALDKPSIAHAISRQNVYPDDCTHWLEQAKVKRYFDFNYTINSIAIFGKTLHQISSLPEGFVLSKYALQLLYFLSNTHTTTEGRLISVMNHWAGSGKYPTTRMGSCISRSAIISQLLDAGLLRSSGEDHGKQRVCISAQGQELLSLLHPDCEDPDLPARLEKWMGMPFSEAQPKMDRYLRTFFGKQKRFMNR